MVTTLQIGDVSLDVLRKDIRNLHLSVHPPTGRVRLAAPLRMSLDSIRVFAISKLDWIRQQQGRMRNQERESPREYLDRESHYLWGKRYLLKVLEADAAPGVEVQHARLVLRVRPGADAAAREALVSAWYRQQLRATLPPLIATWEKRLGVKVNRFHVQQMKTKWGSCNPAARSLRFNTELAKKPTECLEYIVVHEMLHLLSPRHDAGFQALLDKHRPGWQHARDALNRLPLRHSMARPR